MNNNSSSVHIIKITSHHFPHSIFCNSHCLYTITNKLIMVMIFIRVKVLKGHDADILSLYKISFRALIYLQIGQYWHQVCLDQLIFCQCSSYTVLTVKKMKNEHSPALKINNPKLFRNLITNYTVCVIT